MNSPAFKRSSGAAKLLREAVRADVLVELLEGVVEVNALLKFVRVRKIDDVQFQDLSDTEVPAYSDTLGTWEKCHCNQIVTVTRGSLVTNQSFGTCQKCHCKRGVTVNSVTVSGEICTKLPQVTSMTIWLQ